MNWDDVFAISLLFPSTPKNTHDFIIAVVLSPKFICNRFMAALDNG
jgi:hypothetical protein